MEGSLTWRRLAAPRSPAAPDAVLVLVPTPAEHASPIPGTSNPTARRAWIENRSWKPPKKKKNKEFYYIIVIDIEKKKKRKNTQTNE